ncbi:hypothetical protein [Actinokineospora terrae]|uniref:Uncharacterized protein n=1 Tax=Actinokineospora terrae TaxID=155974 RepID=A0A1H9XSJ5_9PSEU|nr:hypothetical protein [Actinokineospora terrae]SES49111.1 hypothetical protein SAMN04487818_12430 [Actinokineospora terrae]
MSRPPNAPEPDPATVEHPATHIGCERFTWMLIRWCVTHARELIAADPGAAVLHPEVDITRLAVFMPPAIPSGDTISLVTVDIDHDAAMASDLERPIIVAPIPPYRGKDSGSVVIDGWEQVYKALHQFRQMLPAYVLTTQTEHTVRDPFPYTPPEWR